MAFGVSGGCQPGILKMSHSVTLWQSREPGLTEESKGVPEGSCATSALFAKH